MNGSARLLLLLLCWCWQAPRAAMAQDALVLGGGGARGLAHAGVVVGLEQLGRDPGLVVGTSMGAVIAALYAAGYEPERIRAIVAEEDWPALFTQAPLVVGPDREPRHPILQLDAGGAPSGLVPDWRINRRLVQLLFEPQARSRGDFDRLARRYRAVAASLETGRLVVLGRGDLARAARASMAVPGAFAPVRWDGQWLVDGGIRDNLPVAVARGLGADSIVAVDVIRPPPLIAETDPVSVGVRGLRWLIENASPAVRPDVLVLPRIPPEIPEAVFPRDPVPLIRAGLDATLAALGPSIAGPVPTRSLPPAPDSLGALEIVGGDPAVRRIVRRVFEDVAPGAFHAAVVLAAVDRLYATGLFSGVWPSVLPAAPPDSGPEYAMGHRAPRLRVHLETTERTMLAGAAGYDNDRGGRVWAAATHRVSVGAPTELGLAASGHALERWATATVRRHSPVVPPLTWSLGGHYREADVRRFDDDDVAGEVEVRRAGGWAGAELRRVSPEAVAALVVRVEDVAVEDGRVGQAWGPMLRLAAARPTTRVVGRAARLEVEARWGDFDYRRARLGGSVDAGPGRLLLAAVADAAAAGGDAPPDALPALGDERLMPGLRWGEARGRRRAVGGFDVAYPIPLEGFVRLRLRAGAVGDPVDRADGSTLEIAGAELGALWPTPLGSLLVAVGAATDGGWRFDVDVGTAF